MLLNVYSGSVFEDSDEKPENLVFAGPIWQRFRRGTECSSGNAAAALHKLGIIQDGGVIPDKYTQASPTPVSPELEWVNVPAGTVSYVLLMHDPDNAPQ